MQSEVKWQIARPFYPLPHSGDEKIALPGPGQWPEVNGEGIPKRWGLQSHISPRFANCEKKDGPLCGSANGAIHSTEMEEDLDAQFHWQGCKERVALRQNSRQLLPDIREKSKGVVRRYLHDLACRSHEPFTLSFSLAIE